VVIVGWLLMLMPSLEAPWDLQLNALPPHP